MKLTFTSAKEAEKFWEKVNRKRIKFAKTIAWSIWVGISYIGFSWMYFRMLGLKSSEQFSEHSTLEGFTFLCIIFFIGMAGLLGFYVLYPTRSGLKAKLKKMEED